MCEFLELAKRLKELGVKQESYFCWAHKTAGVHRSFDGEKTSTLRTSVMNVNLERAIRRCGMECRSTPPSPSPSWGRCCREELYLTSQEKNGIA